MKGGDTLLATAAAATVAKKDPIVDGGALVLLFRGRRYKFLALAAILLLALWSMLTGSLSINFFVSNLISRDLLLLHNDIDLDLDALELEEREKVVRRMWDAYTRSRRGRLPRFWQKAFEAAYEELAGEDTDVSATSLSEIARMSVHMLDLDPMPPSRKIFVGARGMSRKPELPSS